MQRVATEMELKESLGKLDWTARDHRAEEGIHAIHSYPAMMLPLIARRLIGELTNEGDIVLDPFCGSGTVLAEAIMMNRRAVGYDINPLALLIAKVKTTSLAPQRLREALMAIEARTVSQSEAPELPDIPNLQYWFKPEVIANLAKLKIAVNDEEDSAVASFFKVVFARTVRQTSNTRRNEFKLYRLPEERLKSHRPDVFVVFKTVALLCISAMEELYLALEHGRPDIKIEFRDTRQALSLPPHAIDLILTSPPYGDSRTSVAYGQFSRLASQWLDIWAGDVDKESLGGRPSVHRHNIKSVREAVGRIEAVDKSRAEEVESFYGDLYRCLENISAVVRAGGYAVFVVANRRVRAISLPTDSTIVEIMGTLGFSHLNTFERSIVNKHMPSRNSPSNVPGQKEPTMLCEYIVVLRKCSAPCVGTGP